MVAAPSAIAIAIVLRLLFFARRPVSGVGSPSDGDRPVDPGVQIRTTGIAGTGNEDAFV